MSSLDERNVGRGRSSRRRSGFVLLVLGAALSITPATVSATCANGIVERGEQCDDGGVCIGGSTAGLACTSETECIDGGACFGGLDDLRACDSDADCRLGTCRLCRPVGGDGCAANCTFETQVLIPLVPGIIESSGMDIAPGTSGAVIFGPFLTVPLPLTGALTMTVGHSVDGVAPAVIRTGGLQLDPIPVGTGACGCLRGISRFTCGGTMLDADGALSRDCTPGLLDPPTGCPPDRPCAPQNGPGNSGSGFISCSGDAVAVEVEHDCDPTRDLAATLSTSAGDGPHDTAVGNALLSLTSALGTIVGGCTGSHPDYGPDWIFCTDDDPARSRGSAVPFLFTTGPASGRVLNPSDFEGNLLGPFTSVGIPFRCDNEGVVNVSNSAVSGVFTACDQPTISDIVAPMSFGFASASPLPGSIGPTATPGPVDCCQCAEPVACAAADGQACNECFRVPNAECGNDGICHIRSPSPTSSPTGTATPSPATPSATRTQTRTYTPTRTPALHVTAEDLAVACDLPAGTRLPLDVALVGEGSVAAVQHTLVFANAVVDVDTASCRINPALEPGRSLAVRKAVCGAEPQPDDCPAGAGTDISILSSHIIGAASVTGPPIAPGLLYSCDIEILDPGALPSVLSIQDVVGADMIGGRIPVGGGEVRVVSVCATPTATPVACPGDCNGSGQVTVDEIVKLVAIALGQQQPDACAAGDADGDGQITVDEIVAATRRALEGCERPQTRLSS